MRRVKICRLSGTALAPDEAVWLRSEVSRPSAKSAAGWATERVLR